MVGHFLCPEVPLSYDASELYNLARDLGEAPRQAGHLTRTAVRKIAKDVERDAKNIASAKGIRDTGNLISMIGTSDLRAMTTSGAIEAEVVARAEYSLFNEVGTSRMPARPFMGPAMDNNAGAFEEVMGQIAEQAAGG